jgi:hypothetical protein
MNPAGSLSPHGEAVERAAAGHLDRATPSGWLAPLASAAAAVLAVVALSWRDPHVGGSWGLCPVYGITGHYCPGCGSLRAIHDLATGRWGEVVGHNVLVVPALVWLGWWWLSRVAAVAGGSLAQPPSSRRSCWILLAAVGAFTLLRNLPGSALAP